MNIKYISILPPVKGTSPTRLNAFLTQVAKQLAAATVSDDCSIFLADGQDRIVLLAPSNELQEKLAEHGVTYKLGEGLTGYGAKTQKAIHLKDMAGLRGDSADRPNFQQFRAKQKQFFAWG